MSAPSVMRWGDSEVRVASDGKWARLFRGAELVAEVSWAQAVGGCVEVEAKDEVEHTLATPIGTVHQRHSVSEFWRARLVLEVREHDPSAARGGLRVRPGPEFALWSWGSGATALVAVAPAHAPGPVLGMRLEQGYLEEIGASSSDGSAGYVVVPSDVDAPPGHRIVTAVVCDWYPEIDDLAGRLPPWLGETQMDAGESWLGDIADFGVEAAQEVVVDCAKGKVSVTAPPGQRTLDVQTPRGLSRVRIEWVAPMEEVLQAVATEALAGGAPMTPAAALCVQFAADRQTLWLDEAAQERLDRVDFAREGSLLGVAFGLARARGLGEAALVDDALRALGQLPAGVGFSRVAMAGWMASLSVGLDERERCRELLDRASVGRTASLESSLLRHRGDDFVDAELAGLANRLGGRLPGCAPGLNWTETAQLAGLLELCPTHWGRAGYCAQVAAKAKGAILCAYVDKRVSDPEPLAWLLLNTGFGTLN